MLQKSPAQLLLDSPGPEIARMLRVGFELSVPDPFSTGSATVRVEVSMLDAVTGGASKAWRPELLESILKAMPEAIVARSFNFSAEVDRRDGDPFGRL